VVLMANRGTRPERAEIDAAALRLLARHGAQILATARRYAATPEDAEDACQRGLEIMLTKAPSTSEEELIPWLRTVVIRTIGPDRCVLDLAPAGGPPARPPALLAHRAA
jgi:Sigma-70 region 2